MYTTATAASCHPMPGNHKYIAWRRVSHVSVLWKYELGDMRYAVANETELTNVWNESVFILGLTTVLDDFIYFFICQPLTCKGHITSTQDCVFRTEHGTKPSTCGILQFTRVMINLCIWKGYVPEIAAKSKKLRNFAVS
jgi:hypothetical protein